MAACWEEHCLRRSVTVNYYLLLPPSNNPSSELLIISIEKTIRGCIDNGEIEKRLDSHQLVSLRLDPVSQTDGHSIWNLLHLSVCKEFLVLLEGWSACIDMHMPTHTHCCLSLLNMLVFLSLTVVSHPFISERL